MPEDQARYGWGSSFPTFSETPARMIRWRLEEFIRDAGDRQVRAWEESIPPLQREVREVLVADHGATAYSAVLEYELPMESRRPDVILLARQAVVLLELKGKTHPSQADLDQAAAYARDLRCYHRECESRPVMPVVVPMRATGYLGESGGVQIAGPDAVDDLVERVPADSTLAPLSVERFLSAAAYRPLPTLVQAARELFHSGTLRPIHRARAATDPAVEAIRDIIHEAARTRSRRLVLLTGVPGAGKTLVGLRIAHAHFLDDLAVPRANGTPTAPAVFLSGNGPLVEVLQYELRGAGGGRRAFVRGVIDYVRRYSARQDLVQFGVANDFQSTKQVRYGPWYSDAEDAPGGHSCRQLRQAVTEFWAQGLELDAALLAWGTDFVRQGGRWSTAGARGYRRGSRVRDPYQLRVNAYRVLLARGRDATVLFVPALSELDATCEYLTASGFGLL